MGAAAYPYVASIVGRFDAMKKQQQRAAAKAAAEATAAAAEAKEARSGQLCRDNDATVSGEAVETVAGSS